MAPPSLPETTAAAEQATTSSGHKVLIAFSRIADIAYRVLTEVIAL